MTMNPIKLLWTAVAMAVCTGSPAARAEKLYVASTGYNSIYTFDTGIGAASKLTFASGLANPYGIAFDSNGNLFAAGAGNGSIYRFGSSNGMLSATPTTYATGLNNPIALAIDSTGNLFEADYGSGNIYKFTNGIRSTLANGPHYSFGLAIDSQGNLFAGDASTHNIIKFTGNVPAVFAAGIDCSGINFDSNGNLWVANFNGGIAKFSNSNGTLSSTPVTFATGLGHLDSLVFDRQGNLYASRTGNPSDGIIYEFANNNGTLSTTPTTFASGLWGALSLAIGPAALSSVTINCFAGVIIHGTVGSNYVIQAQANMNSNWITLTNITLPTSPYTFIDYSSPTNNQQFYRVTP